MSYSPFQARDANGRWVARGVNAAVRGGSGVVKAKRSSKAKSRRKQPAATPVSPRQARGVGISGLKKNTVPYVRASKHSQTVGVNAGTLIPGTHKRVVFGAYARVENTGTNVVDQVIGAQTKKLAPKGSKRAKGLAEFKKRVIVNNPAIRKAVGGAEVRMGTSRKGGTPSLILRRGRHRTAQPKSVKGVQRYDNRMRAIAGTRGRTKQPRAARRKAARTRVR